MDCARWHAIRTRSRAEKVVRDQLVARGVEPFLPIMSRVSQWKDRKKMIEWPLFPGYCFAKLNLNQKVLVLQVTGAVEIIGSAHGRAEAIPDEEIAALQRVVDLKRPCESYLSVEEGMDVQVIRGPLVGVRGRLIRKASACRLIVSIKLISQGAAVEIDAQDVAPAQSAFQHSESPAYT